MSESKANCVVGCPAHRQSFEVTVSDKGHAQLVTAISCNEGLGWVLVRKEWSRQINSRAAPQVLPVSVAVDSFNLWSDVGGLGKKKKEVPSRPVRARAAGYMKAVQSNYYCAALAGTPSPARVWKARRLERGFCRVLGLGWCGMR